jgi:hypothetical protein
MKESINRAFSYLSANKGAFGVAREVDTSDFHVEVIDLLGNKVGGELIAARVAPTRSPDELIRERTSVAESASAPELALAGGMGGR